MGKVLLILSLLGLLIIGVGTRFYPDNPTFWLASGSLAYQHIREVLAFILLLQLATKPPRHLLIRLVAGAVALVAGVWAIEATYANHMPLFDSLTFLSAALAIGVTALERKTVDKMPYLLGRPL